MNTSRSGKKLSQPVKCYACGGFLPWESWKKFWQTNMDVGNGGVLQRPASNYDELNEVRGCSLDGWFPLKHSVSTRSALPEWPIACGRSHETPMELPRPIFKAGSLHRSTKNIGAYRLRAALEPSISLRAFRRKCYCCSIV